MPAVTPWERCHAVACHAWDDMPCHAMPCRAMPCHAMPCHAMPCHAMLISRCSPLPTAEYNVLVHNNELYCIDVSQAVELDHPRAFDFLREGE